jgi:RNA polymerase sigma-70 factor (ECF subfamily)
LNNAPWSTRSENTRGMSDGEKSDHAWSSLMTIRMFGRSAATAAVSAWPSAGGVADGGTAESAKAQQITIAARRLTTPPAGRGPGYPGRVSPRVSGGVPEASTTTRRRIGERERLSSCAVSGTEVLASPADLALVALLQSGDEAAFMMLVEQHQGPMLRIARMYVSSQAVAEEVVQDAWLGILKGLARFEGRSSLRTWMYRILANIAKTRGQREGRSLPFSSLVEDEAAPAVADSWFLPAGDQWPDHWSSVPNDWRGIPEDRLLAAETLRVIGKAIEDLPATQAEVIRLRDVLGWSSEDVRNALDVSETNQRVLLHRARSRVRRAVDEYLEQTG